MTPKHKRRDRVLKLAVIAIACWVAFLRSVDWAAVHAGEPSKAPPQAAHAKQAPPVTIAIPDSEIIPRAEQTVKSLQKIKSEIAADSTLRSIQKDFATFAEKSDRRRESEAESMSKSRSG